MCSISSKFVPLTHILQNHRKVRLLIKLLCIHFSPNDTAGDEKWGFKEDTWTYTAEKVADIKPFIPIINRTHCEIQRMELENLCLFFLPCSMDGSKRNSRAIYNNFPDISHSKIVGILKHIPRFFPLDGEKSAVGDFGAAMGME